jgi:hypothetical protein
MADITNNEMQTLLERLAEDLDNTKGDSVTADKLESIKKILQKIQTDISKSSNTQQNATAIGKAVAAAINAQAPRGNSNGSNNQNDVVNSAVAKARQDFISEYQKATDALKNYSANIGNGGGSQAGNNAGNSSFPSSAFNTIEKDAKLAAVGEVISKTGKVLIDALKNIASAADLTINSYRQMSNIGETFGGSMLNMRDAARAGNMTLTQFTDALTKGSIGLRELGGNQFAALSGGLRSSLRSVGEFGMTIDQTNDTLSTYIEQQRFSTNLNTINQATLNKNFTEMMLNTSNLSGAFGVARDDIIKDAAALAKDPNTALLMTAIDPSKRGALTDYLAGADRSDPSVKKVIDAAFNIATGNRQDSSTNNLLAADPAAVGGIAQAIQDFNSGKITMSQLIAATQKAGAAGAKDLDSRGSIQYYANNDSAFGQATGTALVGNAAIENFNPALGTAAVSGTQNQTPLTKDSLDLQEATNQIAVALEAAQTTAMKTFQQSITAVLDDYIKETNKLPAASAKLDQFASGLTGADAALAKFIKSLNPDTVAISAAFAGAALEISQFGGALFGMKLAIDAAKFSLGALSGKPSTPSVKSPKNRSSRGRGRQGRSSKDLKKAGVAEGEDASGGVLDDILGSSVFGPAGLAVGTFAAVMAPTSLGTGDTTKYGSNLNLSSNDLYNKVMQKMTPTDFANFEKLRGSARDNFIRQKAISLGIIKGPPGPKSKPSAPSVTLPIANPNAPKGPPRQTPNSSPPATGLPAIDLTNPDPVTNGAYSGIATALAEASQTMNAIQAHIDAVAKRLHDTELSNQKFQDLFQKIEHNTYVTYKNIVKFSNQF